MATALSKVGRKRPLVEAYDSGDEDEEKPQAESKCIWINYLD